MFGTEQVKEYRIQGVKRSRDQMGFTLIELILTILIIGILSAVAVPRMGGEIIQKTSLEGAAIIMASDIRYAQECAMACRISKSVIFNSGASLYTFDPPGSLDPPGQLPTGVTIQNDFKITFNSLGEPILGGGGAVSISEGGQTKTISIARYTGKVNIL